MKQTFHYKPLVMAELTSVDTNETDVSLSKRPRINECGENSSRFNISVWYLFYNVCPFVPVGMDYGRSHQHHMIRGTVSPFNNSN